MKSIKQQLHQLCLVKLNENIRATENAIGEARTAQKEETKSSAGDKYETTREMMTQEIEKHSIALAKLTDDKNRLLAITLNDEKEFVRQGSVIYTNHGNFYLAVSIGALTLDGIKYQTISSSSPIGQLMLNKKQGEGFKLNDKEYFITEIL